MRTGLAILCVLNLLSILCLWAVTVLRHPLHGPLIWVLIGFVVLTSFAPVYLGLKRRLERGRNAGLGMGFHVGVIDIIEGLTGSEMRRGEQAKVQLIVVGAAIVLVGALLTSSMLHRFG